MPTNCLVEGCVVTALETYNREKRFTRYHSVELNREKSKETSEICLASYPSFQSAVPECRIR